MEEFFKLPILAVGQGIHGVDDDSLYPLARALVENTVHDGDHVGKAFPGTGPGCQDVIPPLLRFADGLFLVGMEAKSRPASRSCGFIPPEDFGTNRVQEAFRRQFLDRFPRLERGIQLNQRLRPERAFCKSDPPRNPESSGRRFL